MEQKTLQYIWIEQMSREFEQLLERESALTSEDLAWWDLRIKLAIAQQLSVIASALKAKEV